MLKDRMVRVKMIKRFTEQRPVSYVGKCREYLDNWILVEGRMVMLCRHQPNGVQIDKAVSVFMLPRENVDNIRVLPEKFDIGNMKVTTEGQQIQLMVEGAADVMLGEMGEG